MKAIKKYPVLILFFVFIFAIAIANVISPDKERSEMENAYLQQLPKLSWSSLIDSSERGFTQKFEKYLSDQFILRDGWITAKSVSESVLGKKENNGIIYGDDDYLFGIYRSYDEERLWENVNYMKAFKASYPDIPMDVMLVPSAYTILTDKAPQDIGNIDQFAILDEMEKELSEAGFDIMPVRDVLNAHSSQDIYYRTDHHWTTHGAKLACETYLMHIGRDFAEPDPALKNEVEGFLGTHYSKSKNYDVVPDTLVWYDLPVDSVTIGEKDMGGMYDKAAFDTRDKYAAFLHGNHGITVIENSEAKDGSILVIKDSYANSFVPFLTQSYSEVTVVDLRYLPMGFASLMQENEFDRVLFLYNFENIESDINFYRMKY